MYLIGLDHRSRSLYSTITIEQLRIHIPIKLNKTVDPGSIKKCPDTETFNNTYHSITFFQISRARQTRVGLDLVISHRVFCAAKPSQNLETSIAHSQSVTVCSRVLETNKHRILFSHLSSFQSKLCRI